MTKDKELATNWAAIEKAMEDSRKKNPALGSPAWAREQATKEKKS